MVSLGIRKPSQDASGKWRFIAIPCKKCNNPGGPWLRGRSKKMTGKYLPIPFEFHHIFTKTAGNPRSFFNSEYIFTWSILFSLLGTWPRLENPCWCCHIFMAINQWNKYETSNANHVANLLLMEEIHRNPAPPGMYKTLEIMGYTIYQLVSRISSINIPVFTTWQFQPQFPTLADLHSFSLPLEKQVKTVQDGTSSLQNGWTSRHLEMLQTFKDETLTCFNPSLEWYITHWTVSIHPWN